MLEIHEQFYFEKWLVLTGFLKTYVSDKKKVQLRNAFN